MHCLFYLFLFFVLFFVGRLEYMHCSLGFINKALVHKKILVTLTWETEMRLQVGCRCSCKSNHLHLGLIRIFYVMDFCKWHVSNHYVKIKLNLAVDNANNVKNRFVGSLWGHYDQSTPLCSLFPMNWYLPWFDKHLYICIFFNCWYLEHQGS